MDWTLWVGVGSRVLYGGDNVRSGTGSLAPPMQHIGDWPNFLDCTDIKISVKPAVTNKTTFVYLNSFFYVLSTFNWEANLKSSLYNSQSKRL